MPPKTTTPPQPFSNDAEYIDAELAHLKVRCAHISAEKSAEVARRQEDENDVHAHRPGRTPSREAKCRSLELEREEERLRAEIDGRLAIHRTDGSRPKLGLDTLCEQGHLNDHERLILLAAAMSGVSQKLADDVLGELVSFYGALTVTDIISILEPQSVADWLQYRHIFRPDASLRANGLIVLGAPHGAVGPDTLMGLDVRLTLPTFAVLAGDPDAATELDDGTGGGAA